MNPTLAEYKAQTKRAAMRHGFEAGVLLGMGRLSAAKERLLRNHRAHELGALYGCRASAAAVLVDRGGGLRRGLVEPADLSVKQITIPTHDGCIEHHLSQRWPLGLAAVLEQPQSTLVLNRELRGVSRALWLAVLWQGFDTSAVRRRWYHWTATAPYWDAAWVCLRHADGMAHLLAYGRGLLWRYSAARLSERKPPGTHKAADYIEAVQRLCDANENTRRTA